MVDQVSSETATVDVLDDLGLRRPRADDDHDPVTHVEAGKLEHTAAAAELTLHRSEPVGSPTVLPSTQPDLRASLAARRHGVGQPIE